MASLETHLELLPISDENIEGLKQMVKDELTRARIDELKRIENAPEVPFQTMDLVLKRIAELQDQVTSAASPDHEPSTASKNAKGGLND